ERADQFASYVQPLMELQLLDVVADDAVVAPGVRMFVTPGHTPGATSVIVDDSAILVADVWHSAMQIARPDWTLRFDSDPELAVTTRRRVIELAAANDWLVGVPHTPLGGLGHVRKDGGELRWVAVK